MNRQSRMPIAIADSDAIAAQRGGGVFRTGNREGFAGVWVERADSRPVA
jgi:hypothetical protein